MLQSVDSLSESFLQRTGADVIRLREMLERVRAGEWWALKDVERVAHSIHGTGAMFGFRQLSTVAGEIERLVGELALNATTPEQMGKSAMPRLASCIEQLANEVEAARGVGC